MYNWERNNNKTNCLDCFLITKCKRQRYSDIIIDEYFKSFNLDEYLIYKSTGKQRRVSIEEFFELKYSGYIFFKKDKYDYKEIDESLKLIWDKLCLMYLNKPLPPISIIKKIKVII